MKPDQDFAVAHGIARLGLGINLGLHGLTRIPMIKEFANGMRGQFEKSFLPGWLVEMTAFGIVAAEATLGILLVLGLFLRPSLIGAGLLICLLLFGSCHWRQAKDQLFGFQ